MNSCDNSGTCGPQVIFEFNLLTIVTSTVLVPCGEPVIIFSSGGFELDLNVFIVTCNVNDCTLAIYTQDITFSGEISISFTFYYSGMPSVSVTSNVFIVVIVNPCLPPPGCIGIPGCGVGPPTVIGPSIDIVIDVTVTVDVVVELPPWNCGNPGCDTQVIIDCTINCDIGGGGVVVIINNEININIDTCDCNGCCGENGDGNVIIIVV
jgi:hypothetical protein